MYVLYKKKGNESEMYSDDQVPFFKKYPHNKLRSQYKNHKYKLRRHKMKSHLKKNKEKKEQNDYEFQQFHSYNPGNNITLQDNPLTSIVNNFHPEHLYYSNPNTFSTLASSSSNAFLQSSSFHLFSESDAQLLSSTSSLSESSSAIQPVQHINPHISLSSSSTNVTVNSITNSSNHTNEINYNNLQTSSSSYQPRHMASTSISSNVRNSVTKNNSKINKASNHIIKEQKQHLLQQERAKLNQVKENQQKELRAKNTELNHWKQKVIEEQQKQNNNNKQKVIIKKEPVKPQGTKITPKKHLKFNTENYASKPHKTLENNFQASTSYQFPSYDSLVNPKQEKDPHLQDWIQHKAKVLNRTLQAFKVEAHVVGWTDGPTVTQFQIKLHLGVKVNKVRHLSDDLKMALAAKDIRIQAPIPGHTTCGIEIPNPKPRPVMLSEVLDSETFRNAKSPLTIAVGVDLSGHPRVADLRKMPHGLIAGATGSGKSVFINCMLMSLLYKATPQQLRLILIDPKAVELAPYNGIPQLITPVISNPKQAAASLRWCVQEMNQRYTALEKAKVRNIEQYNQKMDKLNKPSKKMPYIVIVIDELADLMMTAGDEVEAYIVRITQKARAAGLHLIVATQRPSVDIVTGTIKNNIPTRIAFMVSSQVDSRTIIDQGGAERLLGKGDMLYLGSGINHPIRLQGCFVGNKEIDNVVKQVKQQAPTNYQFTPKSLLKKVTKKKNQDKLMPQVLKFLASQKTISTSRLQRVFSIGYNRSAKIIANLQNMSFISKQDGSKPRKVYFTQDDYNRMNN